MVPGAVKEARRGRCLFAYWRDHTAGCTGAVLFCKKSVGAADSGSDCGDTDGVLLGDVCAKRMDELGISDIADAAVWHTGGYGFDVAGLWYHLWNQENDETGVDVKKKYLTSDESCVTIPQVSSGKA